MKKWDGLSFEITPVQIKNKEFKRSVAGYSPTEVVAFLDKVAKGWEAVQEHEQGLLDEIQALNNTLEQWQAKDEEIKALRRQAEADILHLKTEAMEKANEMLKKTHEKVNHLRSQAEEWLEQVFNQLEETEMKRRNYLSDIKSSLDHHYQLLETEKGIFPPTKDLNSFIKGIQ